MPPHRLARRALTVVTAAVGAVSFLLAPVAGATGSGVISGVVFHDANRNGVLDTGEAVWEGHQLYLFDGAGTYRGTTASDAAGRYSFSGLSDGDYRVEYASPSWATVRQDWVPTTTGSVVPRWIVHLAGSATADFGWRAIVRSTTPGAPIATSVGPEGLRVESYNDAVAPQVVHDLLVSGGLVGEEAPNVTVRLDLGSVSATSSSVSQSNGRYSGYAALSYITWAAWLDTAEQTLFHEYGHAWSLYYAFIVQQDGTLSSYLQARGLAGDPRIDSSYDWDRRELIADDYRQLFGTPAARAATHLNTQIPQAFDVPGLRDFLMTTFRQSSPPPAPGPAPAPALTVTDPVVAPNPVVKSATVTASISAPASVTLEIVDARGSVVRSLLTSAPRPAGSVAATWDRKDAAGRRVKAGTYTASIRVVDAAGNRATAATTFRVS